MMMSLRSPVTRLASTPAIRLQASRALSAQTSEAVSKLRSVMEEYRRQHYAQCLPSRFKKDILKAVTSEQSHVVVQHSMERVLHNIGASNRLSPEEVELIFADMGTNGGIPPAEFLKLL